jgi:hypothetical protein
MNQKLHYQQRLVQMDKSILHSCADDAKNTMYYDNIKPSFFFFKVYWSITVQMKIFIDF